MHNLDPIELTRQVCLLAVAVVCVYTDLSRGKLYNAVTLPAVAVGLALAYLSGPPSAGVMNLKAAALAAALGGGMMFVVYLMGGFGAGEVKLMAAVGALAPLRAVEQPWVFVLCTLLYTALIGAAIGIIVLIWRRRLVEGLKDSARAFVRFRAKPAGDGEPKITLPYGVAIGVGVVWAWMELMV